MSNLIDTSFFFGEIGIPNTGKLEVQESLNAYIAKYEKDFLQNLLGYPLYKSYITDSTTQRFKDLINGVEYGTDGENSWRGLVQTIGTNKHSMIANYIYYYWLKEKEIWNSGLGTIKPTPNQGIIMSPGLKMISAWNEMSDQVSEFVEYMNFYPDVYPEWNSVNLWYFNHINDFDL